MSPEIAHSKIGASSMYRWSTCPASVRLSEGIPNRSSKYAEEGTAAHELAARLITDHSYDGDDADPDMVDAVMVYVREVLWAASEPESTLLVEHRFDLSALHPGLFGTCDAIVYDRARKLLRVFDYKHGKGIPVEVYEDGKPNSQLMYYGLGALLSSGFLAETVELVIVQPRYPHPDGPIRGIVFPAIELIDFAADLEEAARRTEDPNAPIVPGDHCRFCPANSAEVCPGVKEKAQTLARLAFGKIEEKLSAAVDADLMS